MLMAPGIFLLRRGTRLYLSLCWVSGQRMACDVISHLVIQQVLIVNEAKYSGVGTQHLCVCYIYRRNHVLLLLAIDEGDANYRF